MFRFALLTSALGLAACAALPIVDTTSDVIKPDPAVRFGELDNGLRYAIVQNDDAEGGGVLRLRINVGSLAEEEDQRGLAHLLEHMAFNGSQNLPEGELTKYLERHGLSWGVDINAYTSFDETVYMLDLPDVTDTALDAGLFVLRETADRLTIAPDAVARERGVVAAESRLRRTPAMSADIARLRFLFPDGRFLDRLPIGQPEVIASAPARRVRDFYEAHYRPDRSFLLFAGDADADDVERRIAAVFSDWSSPDAPVATAMDFGQVKARGLEAGYYCDPALGTSVSLLKVRPAIREPHDHEYLFRQTLRDIADGVLNERFRRLLLTSQDSATRLSFSNDRYYRFADITSIEATTSAAHWESALALIEQELRGARQFGFLREEVERAVATMRANAERAAASVHSRSTSGFALTVMGADYDRRVFFDARERLAHFRRFQSRITPEAVLGEFRVLWGEGDPLVYLTSNVPVENASKRALEVYEASRSEPVRAPVSEPVEIFAYTDFGNPGRVVSRTRDEQLDITMLRFENNVRVNLKRMDTYPGRVMVSVNIDGPGAADGAMAPGFKEAFDAVFIQGGLKAHKYDALSHMRPEAAANVGGAFTSQGIQLGGGGATTDLLFSMQKVAAYITAPAFRDDGIKLLRRNAESDTDQRNGSPTEALLSAYLEHLFAHHPHFTRPSREALLAWTADQIRAISSDALAHGYIEIGIVGDVTEEAATSAIAHTFGALPSRRAAPADRPTEKTLTFPQGGGAPVIVRHSGEPDAARVAIFWPTFLDISDTRGTAIASLLSDVLEMRLRERLREKEGGSYAPGAWSHVSDFLSNYGFIGATADPQASAVDSTFAALGEIAAGLGSEITPDEIERVRGARMAEWDETRQIPEYWISGEVVAFAQTRPSSRERWRTLAEHYRSVSAEDLTAAARSYFTAGRAVRIAVLPEQ
jgi:zinc protease